VLFTSQIFLFAFLPLVLVGWWTLPRPGLRLAFLAGASYVFYGWWDWRFVPLMLASTTVDFIAGHMIAGTEDERARKAFLAGALTINLALLGIFKYAGFFLDSGNGIGAALGLGKPFPLLHLILPIGISFYTFNSMSYTIDIFRRRVPPERSLLRFATFVALFPHLVAGPIVRYETMAEQLRRLRPRLTAELAAPALFLLTCGLIKKLLIADTLAPSVNSLFAHPASLGLLAGWLAALGYSLQLYFDFSGYSDMAVGLALLLGFHFPQNFDSPFKSVNIADFWRRWHMSLSSWLRDYLFIPLGGSRGTQLQTVRNLAIVMFLGGLWHGAALTFVVWGLAHGTFLAGHAVLRKHGLTPSWTWLNRAITFAFVVAAFVVFRAPDLGSAADVLGSMIGLHGLEGSGHLVALLDWRFTFLICALIVFVNTVPNTWQIKFRPTLPVGFAFGLGLGTAILAIAAASPFLYYQF
jgi:alginate O-acetyltransferase complex protein AlgI